MRFQSLGLPSHSFLCFQSLREPYPTITSKVFVFLYAFNILSIFLSPFLGDLMFHFMIIFYHNDYYLSIDFLHKVYITHLCKMSRGERKRCVELEDLFVFVKSVQKNDEDLCNLHNEQMFPKQTSIKPSLLREPVQKGESMKN